MALKTTDLCDDHEGRVTVLAPVFQDYGGHRSWQGRICPARVFEDNSKVRERLLEPGEGRVLVVDGGGSLRCALFGDMMAELARDNGWAGLLIYGCVRDAVELGEVAIGVKALNTHPCRSEKRGVGELDVPVTFAGATIEPGQWLYADPDGVVISPTPLGSAADG